VLVRIPFGFVFHDNGRRIGLLIVLPSFLAGLLLRLIKALLKLLIPGIVLVIGVSS
jgi:hypothetical protein